jgi:hypothetical protein
MNALSASAVLQERYATLKQKQSNFTNDASIELTSVKRTTNTSIELPQAIKELITGSDYWISAKTNRYRKLIREGHLPLLLTIAVEARSKDNPAHWFATTCSKAMWERTLAYYKKLADVARTAAEVAARLKTPVTNFIRKQIWQGVNVIRLAVQAQETGRNPERYFIWLCLHERTRAVV